ncbi:MAG TPA: hypothetical protein VE528_00155, partial [Thermoleophilaceae bacterium]|nr:hypothetical protein [Thermoleophilaceae bacterium]
MPSLTHSSTGFAYAGAPARVSTATVFGRVRFLIAVALGFLAGGTIISKDLSQGAALACSFGGFAMLLVASFGGAGLERPMKNAIGSAAPSERAFVLAFLAARAWRSAASGARSPCPRARCRAEPSGRAEARSARAPPLGLTRGLGAPD